MSKRTITVLSRLWFPILAAALLAAAALPTPVQAAGGHPPRWWWWDNRYHYRYHYYDNYYADECVDPGDVTTSFVASLNLPSGVPVGVLYCKPRFNHPDDSSNSTSAAAQANATLRVADKLNRILMDGHHFDLDQ